MSQGNEVESGKTNSPQSVLKRAVAVELILHDGTHIKGSVYVRKQQALHELMNDLPEFFHLYRDDPDYYLINKSYVAICKISGQDRAEIDL